MQVDELDDEPSPSEIVGSLSQEYEAQVAEWAQISVKRLRVCAAVQDNDHVTLGLTPKQADLLCTTARFCEVRVAPESIYGVLHRECLILFPDASRASFGRRGRGGADGAFW